MNKLRIFENTPTDYNKNNYNLIWSKHENNSNNFLSIFNLKNYDENQIKREINKNLKNFFFKEINKKKIYKIFKLCNDFSLCILSNFVEKNPYKENFNLDLIKITIINKFIKKKKIKDIKIISKNKNFVSKIEDYLNLSRKKKNKLSTFKLNYINFFSLFIKNYLIFSVYILKNINLLFSPKKIENYKPIFVSFFSYTNKTEATKGKYVSEYWKGFNYTKNKNWLHLFDDSPIYKNSNEVRSYINRINNRSIEKNHFFLNDYLTINIAIKSLFKILNFFILITIFNFKLNKQKKNINYVFNKKYYEFFFKELISFSFFRNILLFYQFESFFKKNQIVSDVFYCMENQPWEKIFLYFLIKSKFNNISYGVIHSSIRFWDLRFMNFKIDKKKIDGYFNPDLILSNSKFGTKILNDNGYEKDKILNVETLRYSNLKNKSDIKFTKSRKSNNILILSDYDDECNDFFKKIILFYKDKKDTFIYLKCHKLKPINILQKNLKIIDKFIEIRKKINYVIVSNMTAAALDLYYKGIKPLVYVKDNNLDYSPLYKFINYSTFSSIESLNELIKKEKLQTKKKFVNKKNFKEYFIVDKKLNIWKKLFKYEFKK